MATDPMPTTTAAQDLGAVPVRPAATAIPSPLADARSSDEIKADIERTQARLTSTVDALRDKLTPGAILSDATHSLASRAVGAFGRASIDRRPAAVFFVTLGVALLFGAVFGRRDPDDELTRMIDEGKDDVDELDEFDIDWLEQYP